MPPRKAPVPEGKQYHDFVQPFLIDHSAIHGRMVRLEVALDNILKAHNYPLSVSLHLAEQLVLAALLSATLSKEGILTVQAKGDGPLRFIVVDVMAGGVIRGYAATGDKTLPDAPMALKEVLGGGYLAVTLDPGGGAERYQGIVDLTGETMSDAFRGYFLQSQQAQVMVHVAVRPPDKWHPHWRAGGIIIERMPLEGGKESEFTPEEQDDLWQRTKLFMQTLKEEELLSGNVTPQNLLYRLFGEDGVWVTKLQPLVNGCRCSRAKVRMVLKSLPEKELLESLDKGKLTIHCQFCNTREVFTAAQVKQLFRKPAKQTKKVAGNI